MPNQHDIILSLDSTQFEKAIRQAINLLDNLEAVAKGVVSRTQTALNNINISGLTSQVVQANANIASSFQNVQTQITQTNTAIKQTGAAIKNAGTQGGGSTNPIVNNLNNVGTAATNMQKVVGAAVNGLSVGISHSVGAITVGANVITSLLHEITRNLAISFFNLGFKEVTGGVKNLTNSLSGANQAIQQTGTQAQTFGQQVANAGNTATSTGAQFIAAFKSIDLQLLATYGTFLLLGIVIDKIADQLIKFAISLAKVSGEANLAFAQLIAVLNATGESLGTSLGTSAQWLDFIQQLSIASGKSQKDLTDLSLAFTQVGAEAGLSGQDIQQLVKVAGFTADRFRNSTEQLTNFRQALAGNTRFLANNIPIGNDLAEVTERVTRALVKQGLSQNEAEKKAKGLTSAQKVLIALTDASAPIIKVATEATGSFTIEVRKLNAAIDNLKISFGAGLEGIFASLTRVLREFIQSLNDIPKPIKDFIAQSFAISAIVLEIVGTFLKWIGIIGLASLALTTLNKVINITIPGIGVSLGGLLTETIKKFITFNGTITSVGGVFRAFIPVIASFLAKFALIGTIIFAAIEVFKVLNKEFNITGNVLDTLRGIVSVFGPALTDFFGSFNLGGRLVSAFNAVILTLATIVTALATAFNAGAIAIAFAFRLILLALLAYNKAVGGGSKEIAELRLQIAAVDRGIATFKSNMIATGEATVKFGKQAFDAATNVIVFKDALKTAEIGVIDLGQIIANSLLKNQVGKLTADQMKKVEAAAKQLRGELDQLEVKKIELLSGKSFADQARALLNLKEKIRDIQNTEGGVQFVTEDEINKLKTAKEAFDLLKKAGVKKELAAELEKSFNQLARVSDSVEALDRQKKLLVEIINLVNGIGDNFNKELIALRSSVDLQSKFNDNLLGFSTNFDQLLKKASLENDIRRATLDTDNKIQEVRDRIQKGKIEVQATGQTIRVELSPGEKRKAESDLNKLTKDRTAIIQTKVDELSAKRVNEIIIETQKTAEGLVKTFDDESKAIGEQTNLLENFNKDLAVGIDFANQQLTLRTKDIDLTNKIASAEKELLAIVQLLADQNNNLKPADEARLENLKAQLSTSIELAKVQKQAILDSEKANNIKKLQNSVTEELKKQSDALSEQLNLLNLRADLFKSGVLTGDFNNATEKINILTQALEEQYKTGLRLLDQQKQGILPFDPNKVQELNNRIDDLKASLKALSVVKYLQDAFGLVADAISEAMTDGVRGVIQGTLTIKELFRNMAINILASFAKLNAQKALDIIKNQFNSFAEDILKSDFAKEIGKFFNIDLSKIDFKGFQNPTELLNTATTLNTASTDINTVALDANTAALAAKAVVGAVPGVVETGRKLIDSPILEKDITGLPSIFDQISQDVQDGTNKLLDTATNGFSQFFGDFSTLLKDGIQGISDLFKGGSEGDTGFIGGIFKGILAFFGGGTGAARGIVPGTPNKKDTVPMMVSQGEAIIQSDAVKFYGSDLFNALNNMEVPTRFYENLQDNNASNSLAAVKPIYTAPVLPSASESNQPINITIIDKSPKLDPKSFGMQEKDVIQIVVNGVRKDRQIRTAIREDLSTSRV